MSNNLDNKNQELINLIKTEHTYPTTRDKNLQEKIYKKREFYYHKIPDRGDIKDYQDLAEVRESICQPGKFEVLPHQAFMANLMDPDTPYRGILVFAGTGLGKCLVGDTYVCINGINSTMNEIWNKYFSDRE